MRRTPLDFGEVSSSGEPLGPNLGGSLPSVKLQPSTILGAFKKDSADEPGPCSPRAEQKGAARPAPYSDFRVFAPPDGFDMYPAIRSHRNTLYCPATWKIEPLPRSYSMDEDILRKLEERLGPLHARQRLKIEADHEAQIFSQGLLFFHIENWYPVHSVIRNALKLTGLYWRARRNTERIRVKRNDVMFKELPPPFDGFTILHISDMHVDMNEGAMRRLIELIGGMRYDLCVLTGDYRGKTFGPFAATLEGVARVRAHLKEPVYGVLGDHDTIQMVPGLEAMGIRMLLNECGVIVRGDQQIYLAGIDDAHHFRVDNIEKAALEIPKDEFSILLSHTPEVYRQAAHANFNLMLSGHTHGGQICLPGSIPIILDSVLPRRMGAGAWQYHNMTGYTSVGAGSSVVPVRLNCPPEITLHCLRRG
jgi:predicted MPP superfamily phosphohydrolase